MACKCDDCTDPEKQCGCGPRYKKITASEKANGLREFHCPDHGFLVIAPRSSMVLCGAKVKVGKIKTKLCRKKAVQRD